MTNYDIIKSPIITEKSNDLDALSYKVFKVDPRANKFQIKKAVEEIFNVKVLEVKTINVKPKKKRVGRRVGYRQKYKKAMVKLAEGSTLNID